MPYWVGLGRIKRTGGWRRLWYLYHGQWEMSEVDFGGKGGKGGPSKGGPCENSRTEIGDWACSWRDGGAF